MKEFDLSIIIPCYNEEDSVNDLVGMCEDIMDKNIEVIFVDNGSNDNTYNNFNKFISNKNMKILRLKKNQGYGGGIIEGLNISNGKIISWTHADLQTHPKDIINAYKKFNFKLNNEKVIVKGKRLKRNFIDNLLTKGMGLISSIVLKSNLDDINAQPKIFKRELLNKFKNPPRDFSLDLYLLYFALKNNYEILEFPVYFNKRKYGFAKGGGASIKTRLKIILRTIKFIFNLKKNH